MQDFRMPDSWYDPPEDAVQSYAEEVDARNLWGIFEIDPETGKFLDANHLPDEYGEKDEMHKLWDEYSEEEREHFMLAPFDFDYCYLLAEKEVWQHDEYGGYE
jgi:hypothetical protein